MVQEALSRLPESSRTVLVLREMEGLSYDEISDILHISLGTVKSRLARARQSLKHELEQMMEPAPASVPVWNPAE
jgi:RNA polymerase sigma-70 factor (ECF subfamily)